MVILSPSPPRLYLGKTKPILQHKTGIRCSLSSSSSSSSSTQISTKFDLRTYWKTLIAEINQKLDEAVSVQYPQQIYEAMRYSVLAHAAKRAPPVMCVAACELFGGNRLAAFPTACALEMVHAASLIHDDLPCMDDDPSRRGQPSNHTVFGKKYGEMGECSAVCGGLLGGAGEDEIERLRRYGRAVGVLYQVVDDVLEKKMQREETNGEEKRMRKKKKKKKGKSYVGVYGVEKAMEVAEELRGKAKRELDGFEKYGERVFPLYSFVDYAADRGFSVGYQV
ncbi:hypothetical protein CsSME_00025686 [Camellia sinensis var. sinensis]